MSKKCNTCDKIKPVTEFGPHKHTKDKLRGECKACHVKGSAKWQKDNPDKRRVICNRWGKNNREKTAAGWAKYNASKLDATPPWLTKQQLKQIKLFYSAAAALTKETGIPHEVDHIMPLRGVNSSGLHVPWNLQVITAQENQRKSNKTAYSKQFWGENE